MNIQISEHFTYKKLLRFTLPSIIMMVFTSIYGVIDGFFRIKLCRKNTVCSSKFYYAVSYDPGRRRIYVRYRRQCADFQNYGRRQP